MARIEDMNLIDIYEKDMTIYKTAVNGKRMSPSYKDGLKEVVRRAIDVMTNDERRAIDHYVKTAAINGTTIKKSHPHGPSSVYGAIVSNTQWYSCYMPLFETETNFGNYQGAGPAADRYTEVRISRFCKDFVVKDLLECKEASDWYETFNEIDMEPSFIPVQVPLLLINGTYGIGVGTISQMPPHNINEVIDETIKVMENPNHKVVLVPDQCMPCEIIDNNWKHLCNLGVA